ncbi:MAG: DUF3298 domain-containing protein, partial [Candidatus Staskawiczbacteria bacterium]|nr:DUF3298 domain-containing protein [Candidatus Staskawiczbacteria bacterium]
QQQTTTTNIEDIKIADNTPPLKINIVYPQIAGLDNYNQKAKAIIDNEIKNFKVNSLENDKAVKENDPQGYAEFPRTYDLEIGYDKGIINNNTVSTVFNIYSFEGGAHGSSASIALNYNTDKKSEIKLADLFPNDKNYLQKISDYCIADLIKQMTASGAIEMSDDSWIKEGAGPKEENYAVFLINEKNIVFYFQKYQVAAGAAGDFKVIYPR